MAASIDRAKLVAFDRARSIQDKKKLHEKVLDTIVVAFDLPTDKTADPAHPTAADATTFRDCLRLFRPQDLEEVVSERNIDHRCGYALCNRNIQQQKSRWGNGWSATSKWCSIQCKDRDAYVRRQLSTDPIWLREGSTPDIRLLTDTEDVVETLKPTIANDSSTQEELALERGVTSPTKVEDFTIFEKEETSAPKPPKYIPGIRASDVLEGLPIRTAAKAKRDQA